MISKNTLYSCTAFICFAMVILIIIGPILYINNCDSTYINYCKSTPITCEIDDHYIYRDKCMNDDDIYDDMPFNCYELVIKCIDNNYTCFTSAGYYSSYINAEDYFENHYHHNETVSVYKLKNNTCSFTNPDINTVVGIFGFYSIIFSIILFICLIGIICRYYSKRQRYNYGIIHETDTPTYDSPPKYTVS